jgi:hypothetical protein
VPKLPPKLPPAYQPVHRSTGSGGAFTGNGKSAAKADPAAS